LDGGLCALGGALADDRPAGLTSAPHDARSADGGTNATSAHGIETRGECGRAGALDDVAGGRSAGAPFVPGDLLDVVPEAHRPGRRAGSREAAHGAAHGGAHSARAEGRGEPGELLDGGPREEPCGLADVEVPDSLDHVGAGRRVVRVGGYEVPGGAEGLIADQLAGRPDALE